ncbi:hypothetical protein [Paenibacillus ehimensis]|uniref:hypothetical protein n=1 Tax=Paenibacillus ehimensis TaxID=79264 RepID=UPI000470C9D2|nr:hypothetical protein [Paenibacillus ehimensis]
MKKYLIGFCFGIFVSISSVSYASDIIQVIKSSVIINLNGKDLNFLGSGYEILNYEGNNYVPIRFIAEKMDIPIAYNSEKNKIILGSKEPIGLKNLLKSELKDIEYINIVYGDGIKIRIDNIDDIQKILTKVEQITLNISKNQELKYGYLYTMYLVTKEKEIPYSSNLQINEIVFEPTPVTDELDAIIMGFKPKK